MITVNKANPTPGEITSSLTGSTGDGAGLHFADSGNISLTNSAAAEFGTSDFSLEFVLNQTVDNSNDNYIYFSHTSSNNRIYLYNDISADDLKLVFNNSSSSPATYSISHNMANEYNEVTHYVLTCDRDGNATLYKNGNSVGTADISGSSSVDIGNSNSSAGAISHATNGFGVLGTFYRFRTWNKLLSSAEVQTAFERSDVDYADQYGSQTNLVNSAANGDFSGSVNWGASGNHSISIVSGELKVVATGASTSSSNAATLAATYGGTNTNGKVYKWEFTARASSGTPTLRARTPFDHSDVTTGSYKDFVLSTSNQTFSITGKRIALENAYFGLLEAGTFFIDNVKATQIGCVSDYDLAFANPKNSFKINDRSGAADGTASNDGTNPTGISQVQVIKQLNATAARIGTTAATPADGEVLADKVKVGTSAVAPDAGQISAAKGRFNASDYQIHLDAPSGDDWYIRNPDGTLRFHNTPSDKLTIDSSGNVDLSKLLTITDTDGRSTLKLVGAKTSDGNFGDITARNNGTSGQAQISFRRDGADDAAAILFYTNTGGASEAERMRISSAGILTAKNAIALDTDTTPDTSGGEAFVYKHASNGTTLSGYNASIETGSAGSRANRLTISSAGVATFGNAMAFGGSNSIEVSGVTEGRINIDNNSTDTRYAVSFYNPNGNVGKITTNGLATSYSTSSDYRLKENLEPLTGALDRLDALPVYRFNFKADPDTTVDGFVAHEVSAHVPEAITGEKDAMQTVEIPAVLDDDGNEVEAARTEEQPDYQGIDQSKLVPLLVAAVKELKAKVEALENA